MLRLRTMLFVSLAVLCASTSVHADTILIAHLTNSQEPSVMLTTTSGAPRPESFGEAIFTLNSALTAMTFSATIFNIDVTGTQTADTNDNLRAAHIHAGTTPTPTWPVVWGFFGAPFNDNNPNDMTMTPFATGVGGMFGGKWDMPEGNSTTLAAQVQNVLSGHSYINFHTLQNTGGEIRGALQVVPEPSTLFLLGSGLAWVIVFGRRRLLKKV